MLRLRPYVIAALILSCVPALHAARGSPSSPRSGQWAHENSPLSPDPLVTWGRLDNGVRYALRPHQGVPGRVALRLVVLAGSMDERPQEAGLAHFMEHMAFRGTRGFRAADMVALFQRLGVEYGSDVNAVTAHDYTSYMLDYRENSAELLREGLKFFRGIADGPTFDPAAIEQERRVIMAEMRSRGGLSEQQLFDAFPIVFRGLSFARHVPIGTERTIASFNRNHFIQFHQRQYRPDLMVIVAAGDFDPAEMATLVREGFGDLPRAAGNPPERDEGRLDARGLRAGIFQIRGVGSVDVMAASVVPPDNRPDSRESRIERQRRSFVMEMLAERLRTRVPGVGGAQAEHQRMLGYDAGMASVSVGGNDWAHGILGIDQIIRNTHQNGFDPAEVQVLRNQTLRMARHMAEQIPTLDPLVFCDALTDSITEHTVFTGLDVDQAWMIEWLQAFNPAEALQTFRNLWNPDNLAFHVSGGVDHELKPADIIQRVQQYRRGGLTYLQPPLLRPALPTLRSIGPAGQVTERREVPELGAVLMRFGNNVRFNFVPSNQEPGIARAVVRVGSGLIDMPGRQPALKEFGLNTVLASGTGRLNSEQVGRLVEEHLLSFSFDLGDRDAFTFRGEMAAGNTATFLGLVAEFLHRPQFAGYAHDSQRMQAAMGRSASTVGFGEGMRELTDHLFQGDARFTWGTPIDYISLSVVDVRRWMEPALTAGYVEITLVGDLSEADATAVVARTLGALGPRAVGKAAVANAAPARVTAAAGFKRVEFVGEHHLGLSVGNWPVHAKLTLRDQGALTVLAKVLEIRMREQLRENLGLTYSPAVSFEAYDGFEGLAMIQATADGAPTTVGRMAEVMTEVGARLAAEGVQEGEFIGSRGILTSQLRRAFADNSFLLSMLLRAQERPDTLVEAVEMKQGLIGSITLDEVNSWARQVLAADNSRTAALVPKAFIGIFEAGGR